MSPRESRNQGLREGSRVDSLTNINQMSPRESRNQGLREGSRVDSLTNNNQMSPRESRNQGLREGRVLIPMVGSRVGSSVNTKHKSSA
jgi:hypothetical protein